MFSLFRLRFCGDQIYLEYWRPLVRPTPLSSNLRAVIILKRMFVFLFIVLYTLQTVYIHCNVYSDQAQVQDGSYSVLRNSSTKVIFNIYFSYSQYTCPSVHHRFRALEQWFVVKFVRFRLFYKRWSIQNNHVVSIIVSKKQWIKQNHSRTMEILYHIY